jgi:hypothetical protein
MAYLPTSRKQRMTQELILGNYQVGYGQGIIVNMDKSRETIPIIHVSNIGIRPHNSFNNQAVRGISATFNWKYIEQSFYYAYNSLDGKILQDNSTGEHYTESIQRSGLYRT